MTEAILLHSESYHHPNMLWRTGFLAPDPFTYIEVGGTGTLLVSPMEFGRAAKQARVESVRSLEDFGIAELRKQDPEKAEGLAIARAMRELGADTARVDGEFPLWLAQLLDDQGIELICETALFRDERRHKSEHEIEAVAESQAAAQSALDRVRELLTAAEVRDGMLYRGTEPITSAMLANIIELELLAKGCGLDDVITAGGSGSADPHNTDTGHLEANQPIIVDIFPFNKHTRYFGDITRTFVVGEPSAEWLRMYDAVKRAYEAALAAVKPGAAGRDVHMAASSTLYDAGFGTLVEQHKREGTPAMIHSTGHGVGLEIHEQPRLADAPGELREGDIITIEPGLYHPDLGGVRIEDTVVVTTDGYRNLTHYPTGWRP